MNEKEKKEIFRQLNLELCELCKSGDSPERVRYLIGAGADIFCTGLKPLSNAAKKRNFDIIDILIDAGVLSDKRAVRIIASVCDYKNFGEDSEARFFALLDRATSVTGWDIEYFVPYINSMLVHGKTGKLFDFLLRYYISERQAAAVVYPRMIFETINNGYFDSLEFISENLDWMVTANLDIAVSSGEVAAVKYMLQNSAVGLPSESAILAAIFEGSTEILSLLKERGWNPKNNPHYLKKACRAFLANNPSSLLYLLDYGYTLQDTYEGRTIKENAIKDNNEPLLRFLESREIA